MKKIQVEATNATEQEVPLKLAEDYLCEVIREAEKQEFIDLPEEIIISVAFVGEDEIKMVNKKYRKKDETTDVLSFCYEKKHDTMTGEMLLCMSVISENAKSDGIESDDELKKNITHSFLHILGFEHGEDMFSLQDRFIKKR